ncbi:MAG: hypothetical protein K9N09_07555 [Candidatus Cloacimonetes bacterium]|nr:hypothetical protein [Candidatus Cloacimonadota bacterium]MCF7814383.1 hypothetical protein [Candidatus Cloacimonadota bacterium]MCF7868537.1 hypothetical protein [Candidatus Cloacimonadota bacterium]MCF7884043.1 hypothetical protein [Candidatus Cloacimonadota bacterium]
MSCCFGLKPEFSWQEEYIAISVSPSALDRTREYIKNQEEHHRVKSFQEEYNLFLEKIGLRNE